MTEKKKPTTELIVEILGIRYPLTLKEIHISITLSRILSYQAVHKLLNEMVKRGIVEKVSKSYMLKKEWIEDSIQHFSHYYTNYFHVAYNSNQVDPKTNIQVFRFYSVKEAIEFLRDAYYQGKLDQSGDKSIYASVRILPPFLPQSLFPFIKQITKKDKIYVLCRGKEIYTKWAARLYESLGIKVKTGMQTKHHNSICFGDCAVQYYFSSDRFREKVYKLSKTSIKKALLIVKATSDIITNKTEIMLIVNRNPVLVNDIKAAVLEEFSTKPKP